MGGKKPKLGRTTQTPTHRDPSSHFMARCRAAPQRAGTGWASPAQPSGAPLHGGGRSAEGNRGAGGARQGCRQGWRGRRRRGASAACDRAGRRRWAATACEESRAEPGRAGLGVLAGLSPGR